MRTFLLAFLLSLTLPVQAADISPIPPVSFAVGGDIHERLLQLLHPDLPVFDAACCKVCHKGKACGDTCIARTKTCHVGPGCACQGS